MFTDFHIRQCRLIRIAFQVEVLQNGLRKRMIQAIKASARGEFDAAISRIRAYSEQVRREKRNAEEAVTLVRELLFGGAPKNRQRLTRKQASKALDVSCDALRNWERNGLLTVKRKENGYRVYTEEDICRLKIIRCLRCANYSLEAILRLLRQLSENPETDILSALNTPRGSDDIVSVCDKLISSLSAAEKNAEKISDMLQEMNRRKG